MEAQFRTAITDLFGTRLPIVAGGLHWLADANYVAAAARAGIIGFITASSFENGARLRAEIDRCRDLAEGRPFGVNISMLPKPTPDEKVNEYIDEIIGGGVRFVETSGRSPEAFLPRLHAAGIKVLHKAPSLRHAKKAESLGVDAVSIVGAECGGHPGVDLIGSMIQGALAGAAINIPMLLGGGIGTGRQVMAALALGVDGVTIGTRFLVADEIWAHDDYKELLITLKETDTALMMQSVRNTVRALRNSTTEIVNDLERTQAGDFSVLRPHVAGALGRQAYLSGDASSGALSLGQAVAFADRREPLARIIERIEAEMISTTNALSRFH
ncbi:NAD(P)H-dependent flavin oxidoreductase [Cupriavidus lacunae]|uniref:Nitronate monooxygenase n=1 Tax=Cupriavidus lacunae TaxID=2666307 RepID=A0A370P237_9BURK|nr:nitronate monooxygenase [Cupriavidus lacunae]RDK11922.1 nitronate monooxygenase [Cupriavidus lacunae]